MTIRDLTQAEFILQKRNISLLLCILSPQVKYYRDHINISPIPTLSFAQPIQTQCQLAQFNNVSELMEIYNNRRQMAMKVLEASKMIGKRVIKNTRKPFKGGDTVNTVANVRIHPYKPGWSLAYTFEEDDSCVSIEQVREYCGD